MTLAMMTATMRNYYQGTPYDMTKGRIIYRGPMPRRDRGGEAPGQPAAQGNAAPAEGQPKPTRGQS